MENHVPQSVEEFRKTCLERFQQRVVSFDPQTRDQIVALSSFPQERICVWSVEWQSEVPKSSRQYSFLHARVHVEWMWEQSVDNLTPQSVVEVAEVMHALFL